jgi:hypothetical protein
MSNNRRKFIQQIGALGGVGLVSATGMSEVAAAVENQLEKDFISEEGTTTLTILQTTDVHCQVHPHDELFWENGKSVFRKTGGYAHLATYLEKEKKKNPAQKSRICSLKQVQGEFKVQIRRVPADSSNGRTPAPR